MCVFVSSEGGNWVLPRCVCVLRRAVAPCVFKCLLKRCGCEKLEPPEAEKGGGKLGGKEGREGEGSRSRDDLLRGVITSTTNL